MCNGELLNIPDNIKDHIRKDIENYIKKFPHNWYQASSKKMMKLTYILSYILIVMDQIDNKKQTLMEKNRLYQQRYAEKKRLELGDEAYREQHNKKIQAYREQRKKEEGYVKKPTVEPIMKAPKQYIYIYIYICIYIRI